MGIFVVTAGTPGLLPKSMRLMSASNCCSSEAESSSMDERVLDEVLGRGELDRASEGAASGKAIPLDRDL